MARYAEVLPKPQMVKAVLQLRLLPLARVPAQLKELPLQRRQLGH